MPTVTVSTRVDAEEARLIESLATEEGCDRSTLMKMLLRRGISSLRIETAVDSYAKGVVTLSRAAEKSGLSIWDFIALMPDNNLSLNYDLEEFENDLRILDSTQSAE